MRTVMRESADKLQEQAMLAEKSREQRYDEIVYKWETVEKKKYPRLFENWNKLSDSEKRKTAVYMENQLNHMKALMKETSISSSFSLTPEKVLEVIRLSAPNSNLGNIFREIPMLSTDDTFYFVNAVYDGTPTRSPSVDGTKYYESTDRYFASEKQLQTLGTGDGSTVTFTATMTTTPLRTKSVILVVNGAYEALDDGDGAFSESTLLASSTIVYSSGSVSVTFDTAPASGVSIQVEYNWDSENTGNYDEFGQAKINIVKHKLEAKISPLGFSYTKLVELIIGTTGLGDAKEILTKSVAEELMKARDYRAVQLGRWCGKSNTTIMMDTNFANAGADSEWEHAQMVTGYINKAGNAIFNDLKRGAISKIVAGPGACTYLSFNKTWTDDYSQPEIGLHLVGKIGRAEVYKCPADANLVANNEIMCIYKNPANEADSAITFGTLIQMFDAGTLTYPQTFKTEGALAHFGDAKVVEKKYIRMLTLSNLNY